MVGKVVFFLFFKKTSMPPGYGAPLIYDFGINHWESDRQRVCQNVRLFWIFTTNIASPQKNSHDYDIKYMDLHSFLDGLQNQWNLLVIGGSSHNTVKQYDTIKHSNLQGLCLPNWKILPFLRRFNFGNVKVLLLLSMWNLNCHRYLISQIFITCKISKIISLSEIKWFD